MRRSAESRPLVPRPAEPLPPSDAELIAASRVADAAAYASLYQRHVAAARSVARQLVRGRAEADDIVAEAFAKVLDQLRRGGGPDGGFRPYLLTTVRRAAIDRLRAEGRLVVTDEMEAFDPGVPFADPVVADLERTMIARAFASLPERWRAVLWHTEIEGARPAEVAALLGLTANGVAALAYRAREGLRQAYLQMHLSGVVRGECRPVVAKLGPYVRDGLAKREAAAVAAHLDQCADCRTVYLELADVNEALRGVVAPIILGPAAAAYLASVSGGGGVTAWFGGRLAWFRHAPKSQQAATAGAATAGLAGLVVLALALTANTAPATRSASPPVRTHPALVAPPNPPSPRIPPVPPVRPAHSRAPSSPPYFPGGRNQPPGPPARSGPRRSVARPGGLHRPSTARRPRSSLTLAALAALINPVGTMLPGGSGIVEFTVSNLGKRQSRQITAAIALPTGVRYVDPPIPGGWTCRATTAGASCAHRPLPAGTAATGYLPVMVAADAPAGAPPRVVVTGDGGPAVTAAAKAGVATGGLGARFAAAGRYTVATAGGRAECASGASLALPGQVVWAGLYWAGQTQRVGDTSGDTSSDNSGDSEDAGDVAPDRVITLRGPAGDYQAVAATQVGYATGPGGRSAFEAFADVTSVVAQYGAGVWSAAPLQPGGAEFAWASGQGALGARWTWHGWPRDWWPRDWARDFGWSLVVVTTDPAAAPGTQVMVLDGAHMVGASSPHLSVPLHGLPPGSRAVARTVTWTRAGPRMTSFAQNLAESPAVNFARGSVPYLVGVVAVTDAPPHRAGRRGSLNARKAIPDGLTSLRLEQVGAHITDRARPTEGRARPLREGRWGRGSLRAIR
ncbi:MAG: sigma-70 family RNA polymerase sigma factor [Streptosporangiaceae bacterium]|nr:sigma-70 family RNA polymerase sigma factor [Streptosporangiaceae bacterium]